MQIAVIFLGLALMFAASVPAFAQEEETDPAAAAVELFQKAQDQHEKGDLASAVSLYEKAIAAVPDFPEAEYQRGQALLSLGRLSDAEKAFRRAVEIRPDWTLALANLGSLLVGKGSYPEAEKLLTRAISLDNQNTLAYSALTELRLNSKANTADLKDLLGRLTTLTTKAKPTAAAWAARAALETALGEKAAARASFDKALELDPKNQFALIAKANAALDEGDSAGAESIARTLESRSARSPALRSLKARILLASGKTSEALALLESIGDPTPDIVELRDRILVSSNESGPDLEKRLEKDTRNAFVLGKLCSAFRTSNPAKALEYCRRAAEADPSNSGHAIGFAAAMVQAKMYPEAIEMLRRLQATSPDNVTVRANLATALFQSKRYAEAKTEYRWLTEKQPSSAIAYYFLGITFDHLEEYPDAMVNYQSFLKYADPEKNKVEIEKVNLRLPLLQKQIKEKKGKRS